MKKSYVGLKYLVLDKSSSRTNNHPYLLTIVHKTKLTFESLNEKGENSRANFYKPKNRIFLLN